MSTEIFIQGFLEKTEITHSHVYMQLIMFIETIVCVTFCDDNYLKLVFNWSLANMYQYFYNDKLLIMNIHKVSVSGCLNLKNVLIFRLMVCFNLISLVSDLYLCIVLRVNTNNFSV